MYRGPRQFGLRTLFALTTVITIVCLAISGASRLFRHHSTRDGIEIYGDARFVHMIGESLEMLQERSPNDYSAIRPFVGQIEQATRSSANPLNDPGTIYMSAKNALYSQTWCAGTIAHVGYRLLLYRQYAKTNGTPVPNSVWGGPQVELECLKFQLDVAKNIGAPASELEHLAGQISRPDEIKGTGATTWLEFWKRDW